MHFYNAYVAPLYGNPKYLGAKDMPDAWIEKQCQWYPTTYQPYVALSFSCQVGYTAINPGLCRQDNLPTTSQCSSNNGAVPGAVTGRPIESLTGSKIFQKTDFETSDGALALRRWFSSGGYGGVTQSYYTSRWPIGFANWRASFSIQLTISPNYSYASNEWLVTLPSGRSVSFKRNSDGSFSADNGASTALPATDVKLAFVGTWPSSSSNMVAGPTTWKVTDEYDNVWTLQTYLDAQFGNYTVALPVSMVDRNGLVQTYTYGTSAELTAISDSAGKSINFVWMYNDPSTVGVSGRPKYPVAISEADLPDGSRILYSYMTNGQPTTGLLRPDVLAKVEFHDTAGVLQDAESYNYGDARFIWYVTDIMDKNGVTRWSVTYDSAGRAITSQGPGGAFATSVAYTPLASTFTRTVTNALGKQAIYQYAKVGVSAAKLTGVNGQATTHCAASNSSYAYDATPFLTSETDENGGVTVYTRNSRGLPTQIIEAQGTSSARTTNITWHPTMSIPSEIVAPERTTDFTYTSAP